MPETRTEMMRQAATDTRRKDIEREIVRISKRLAALAADPANRNGSSTNLYRAIDSIENAATQISDFRRNFG